MVLEYRRQSSPAASVRVVPHMQAPMPMLNRFRRTDLRLFSLTALLIPLIAAACLLGCSPPRTECSGNLCSFVAQCITNRRGYPVSTNVSAVQLQWSYCFRPHEDIIHLSGDHFSQIQSFLRQAYGDPDTNSGIAPIPPGSKPAIRYLPSQIGGVLLSLSGGDNRTDILIQCPSGPGISPPKPLPGTNGWQRRQ